MRAGFVLAAAAIFASTPVQAGIRADRNKALHLNLINAAAICSQRYGFTLGFSVAPKETLSAVQARTETEMVAKIDAYWLLHGGHDISPHMDAAADPAWSSWFRRIAEPVVALMKGTDQPQPGEREAAAAAVAASKDPSVYDEAKARYMTNAMRPSNAALEACTRGSRDEFIGKHYWSGQASPEKLDEIERETSDYFPEFVESLKQ